MAWQEGEKIGPYLLGKQLGQGGMATVYKAYHPQLDRHVAIKVMHHNFLDDPTFVARFTREAQIVARLEHAHIVPVYDFDEHDGLPFLVMKYIEGMTLKRKLIKTGLTLDDILHVMTAVGDAMTYAHQQGVLHRDIKPSNIVIDKANVPYLTDFGLARLAKAGESTMSADVLLGTPHYISPEQAQGQKDLDGRTDIYSLGVVLYELLVGHVPFIADTPYAVIHDHIYTPPPSPIEVNPEIPYEVEQVLYKALAKDPADRYTAADVMVKDLRKAIEDSQLTKLSEDRATFAEKTINEIRAAHQKNKPQSIAASQVIRQPDALPRKYKTATVLPPQRKWYQNERIWPVGGFAALLLIVFLSLGVILNASTNFLELAEIVNLSDIEAGFGGLRDTLSNLVIPQEFKNIGVQFVNDPFPHYEIPRVDVNEARALRQSHADSPFSYLVLAHSIWQSDEQSSITAIRQGLSFAFEEPIYMSTAAYIANQNEAADLATLYAIVSLNAAKDDSQLFATLRPALGEYIYITAGLNAGNGENDLETLTRNLAATGLLGENRVRTVVASAPARIAIAKGQIAEDNERAATIALSRVADEDLMQAEINLLRGEIAAISNNLTGARRIWDGILGNDVNAPEWVIIRAEELLEQLEE